MVADMQNWLVKNKEDTSVNTPKMTIIVGKNDQEKGHVSLEWKRILEKEKERMKRLPE